MSPGTPGTGWTECIHGIQFGILVLSCHSSHTTGSGAVTVTSAVLSTQPAIDVRAPLETPPRSFAPDNPRDESGGGREDGGRRARRSALPREGAWTHATAKARDIRGSESHPTRATSCVDGAGGDSAVGS